MNSSFATQITNLIGNTPLLKIPSLSKFSGCEILAKCEFMNPGGSIKDRAAYQMILDAESNGLLKPGDTIVEGTAGNTGIGLALVAKARGYKMVIFMPNNQAPEKSRLARLYGADVRLIPPVPFVNESHFYHQARKYAEENSNTWWANQFENLSNSKAHYTGTAPEIWQQTQGNINYLIAAAGTGGTIGGCSNYLKEKNSSINVTVADPLGSGLYEFVKNKEFKSQGSSFTEGIGIMRLVANFKNARVDDALSISDRDLVAIAEHIRQNDGILVGSSSALNLTAALKKALQVGPGKIIVTFLCDSGERAAGKLYNDEFLATQNLRLGAETLPEVLKRWKTLNEV